MNPQYTHTIVENGYVALLLEASDALRYKSPS